MKMFERIVVGLLVLMILCMGAAFYTDWKLAVQVRSLKAFVEGYVFAEAVTACAGMALLRTWIPRTRSA